MIKGEDFNTDYAISLGGDGTFLRAASKVGAKKIPIIGVNMGRLGFLANVLPSEIKETLDDIYNGNFDIDERSVIKLESENEANRNLSLCLKRHINTKARQRFYDYITC